MQKTADPPKKETLLEPPQKVMDRKGAGKKPLAIDEDLIKKECITVTFKRKEPGAEPVEETMDLLEWASDLMTQSFSYDEDSGDIKLPDGTEIELTGLKGTTVPFTDMFFKGWAACKKPFWHLTWFYVDHDEVMDDPTESWQFFLTDGHKIIEESYSIIHSMYSNQKTIWDFFYEPIEHTSWRNIDREEGAFTEWMYRKFFTETVGGQIKSIALGLKPASRFGSDTRLLLYEIRWIKGLLFLLAGTVLFYVFLR